MGNESLIEIKVLGQTFTVKTDADENRMQEIARFVNEKMDDLLKRTKTVSSLNVAILTALNIAEDFMKEREKRLALLKEIGMKSKDLVERIDMKLGGKEAENVSTEKAPISE